MSAPALYEAVVTHARTSPLSHQFRHRTFYALVDVDRPPPRVPFLARYDDPRDHLDIRDVLARQQITPARILRLASPRTFGYVFNPISLYWCYAGDGTLAATVAEVHNTYGERHAYVLHPDPAGRARVAKRLYVSPFYPVDGDYTIRVGEPRDTLAVSVTLHRPGDRPFVASLRARRHAYSAGRLARLSARYPAAPLRVSALIRRHGVELWARGLQVQPR